MTELPCKYQGILIVPSSPGTAEPVNGASLEDASAQQTHAELTAQELL